PLLPRRAVLCVFRRPADGAVGRQPGLRPVHRRWPGGPVRAGAARPGGVVPPGAEWARAVLRPLHGAGGDGVPGGAAAAVSLGGGLAQYHRARNGKPGGWETIPWTTRR